MNGSISHIAINCKRHFLVFATMLLVLLTSCAVKGSIKSLAGIPIATERSIPKSNQQISSNVVEKCAEVESADAKIVRQASSQSNDLLPAILFATAFLLLFSRRFIFKENKHPVYNDSSKIRITVPIFLEYRKLIIYFTR